LKSQLLQAVGDEGETKLQASGAWTVANAKELDKIADDLATGRTLERSRSLNAASIEQFDTFGARMLDRLTSDAKAHDESSFVVELPPRYRDLYDRVSLARRKPSEPADTRWTLGGLIRWIEQSVGGVREGLSALLAMLGEITCAAGRVALNPRKLCVTSIVNQLDRAGWQAVPIILLITFLIGCIIAQQGFFHFRKFGADEYVVDMVGILVLREIGVLIVAVMVAGRSGSAYTAELGSMKMREEIDALKTMGLDPIEILVLPRVIALIIALPMLDFLGSMAALYGGGLTAWLYGNMSPEIFIARLKDAISITHFKVGLIKAPFMALAIGVVACTEGFAVKGSAESLGRRTTSSVVKAIFLVIVLDGLFAIFFAAIGM
jgi:phospholipid/cholesterol/gamma-HCH transport system permease protein